jgi:hypothetical protein
MNKIHLLEKYPVYVEELAKADTDCKSADDVIAHLRGIAIRAPDWDRPDGSSRSQRAPRAPETPAAPQYPLGAAPEWWRR